MKHFAVLIIGLSLLSSAALGQERPKPVSLIQLMANPEKFDGMLLMVQGFLRIEHEKKHGVHVNLYLHEEDAKNLLWNETLVVPSDQMLKDEEKIDRKYVFLTGVFHTVHAAGNDSLSSAGVFKDIRSCIPWSDPKRPISDKRDEPSD